MIKRITIAALVCTGLICAGAQAAQQQSDYGSAAPASAAGKMLTITPQTKWVNVDNGETVTFVNGSKMFTWNFRTLREEQDLPLAAIAPAGFNAGNVEVYVARDPLYR